MNLSERAKRLKPSPTIGLNTLANELKKSGRDVINLAVGEPDWDTFANIKKTCHDALEAGMTKYVSAAGLPELRQAVVDMIYSQFQVKYEASQCVIGMGAKPIIYGLFQLLCDPGDEVVIPAPYWVSYPVMAELADAKPVIAVCPKETKFKLTPDILKRSLTAKTKIVLLNSPNNPTGQVYTENELKDLASVLERTGRWVISDDIYDRMVFTGQKFAPHLIQFSEKLRSQLLLVNSLSKTYSMTGWRLGSLVGDKKVVDALVNFQSQNITCAVPFAQKAGVTALTGSQTQVEESIQVLARRMKMATKALQAIPGVELEAPEGAFYLFPNISSTFGKKTSSGKAIQNSSTFAAALLEETGVVLVPGVEFGAEGHVRMSATIDEKRLAEGLARISQFISQLR